jgi:multiple sugar transport system permease protein
LLAWLMQAIRPGLKRFVEAMVIGAWILPEVVIGFAWFAFLDYDNGTLNMILRGLGLPAADLLFGSSSCSTPGAAPPSR